jgi:polysaccharide deacetylase 2 family uncharacterized protein YibQ
MLMGPQRKQVERPGVIASAVFAVLALGVGIGYGIGIAVSGAGGAPPPAASTMLSAQPRVAVAVDRPAVGKRAPSALPQVLTSPAKMLVSRRPAPRPPATAHADQVAPPADPPPALASAPPRSAATRPVALTLQTPAPRPSRTAPAWVRYAVPTPAVNGRPMIAVVIDDLGLDRVRTRRMIMMKGPLTLSFMTYAHDLAAQTRLARAHGHELLLHMPMQPDNPHLDAGPNVLDVGMAPAVLRRRIDWGLNRFTGYVGVNNHMGSRFTADAPGMAVVMAEMKRHGLLFLDSVTTNKSVAPGLARRDHVPFASRDVFLDDVQTVSAVDRQLREVERLARRYGAVIAIGHAHDATLAALHRWLPTLSRKGLVLVPLTAIVDERYRQETRLTRR